MRPATAVKAFVAIALWGASFVATKIALQDFSPLAVVVLRFGLGILFVLALLARRGQLRIANLPQLPLLAALGLVGITFHQLLQSFGLLTTSAMNSGWIVALSPVFTAVLARLLLDERFGPARIAGLIVATTGAGVIVGRGASVEAMLERAVPGDLLLLVSAANWALFTTWSKRAIAGRPPLAMLGHMMAFGWIAFFPVLAATGGWQQAPDVSTAAWGSVLFLGIGCSGIAYAFWYDALAETEATALSSFLYLEPVVTVVVANMLLGEPITLSVVAGGAAILAGVWLVNKAN